MLPEIRDLLKAEDIVENIAISDDGLDKSIDSEDPDKKPTELSQLIGVY
jgi:hypothetical protein